MYGGKNGKKSLLCILLLSAVLRGVDGLGSQSHEMNKAKGFEFEGRFPNHLLFVTFWQLNFSGEIAICGIQNKLPSSRLGGMYKMLQYHRNIQRKKTVNFTAIYWNVYLVLFFGW